MNKKEMELEEYIMIDKNEKEMLESEIERLKVEKYNLELEIKGYVEHKEYLIKDEERFNDYSFLDMGE